MRQCSREKKNYLFSFDILSPSDKIYRSQFFSVLKEVCSPNCRGGDAQGLREIEGKEQCLLGGVE
jgi:hypothetical protein